MSNLNDDYAIFVEKMFKRLDTNNATMAHAALGIAGEAGEVVDLLKKTYANGRILNMDKLIKEMGDLCFYQQALMNQYGLTWEQIMRENMDKLNERYEGSYSDEKANAGRT